MGKYRSKTETYAIYRTCERMPHWVATEEEFYSLTKTAAEKLLTYCFIREAEEAEILALRSGLGS